MNQTAVECIHVSKYFGPVAAVREVNLRIQTGEILALVGPSGCGKTTLLRLLAGFERPDTGCIAIQGRLVAGDGTFTPPERRGVGMVFQDYALFPHLTVQENVAFGLGDLPKQQRLGRVQEMLDLVGLKGCNCRSIDALSGGERQRVALARALAPQPVMLLLDEPFSNLDADRRAQMREEVRAILKETHTTAVFVTHDQEEALAIGDRLAVLYSGGLEQVDAPDRVFGCPATRFVAEFMGQTDFLPGQVTPDGILTEIGLLPQRIGLPAGAQVEVAVRADDVQISPTTNGNGVVISRNYKGFFNIYRVQMPSGQILHSIQPHTRVLSPGAPVNVQAEPHHDLACFYEERSVA
jgi:iron(III) transport system ATP-binding protein